MSYSTVYAGAFDTGCLPSALTFQKRQSKALHYPFAKILAHPKISLCRLVDTVPDCRIQFYR